MLPTIKKTLRYPLNFMADWLTFTFIDGFYKVDKPYPLPAFYHCPLFLCQAPGPTRPLSLYLEGNDAAIWFGALLNKCQAKFYPIYLLGIDAGGWRLGINQIGSTMRLFIFNLQETDLSRSNTEMHNDLMIHTFQPLLGRRTIRVVCATSDKHTALRLPNCYLRFSAFCHLPPLISHWHLLFAMPVAGCHQRPCFYLVSIFK